MLSAVTLSFMLQLGSVKHKVIQKRYKFRDVFHAVSNFSDMKVGSCNCVFDMSTITKMRFTSTDSWECYCCPVEKFIVHADQDPEVQTHN